jgi:hypothetical protein
MMRLLRGRPFSEQGSRGISRAVPTIMTIESHWKSKYEILKGYIASNPEICIAPQEIYIPEDLRNRFYECFNNVRRAVIESWKSSFSFDVYSLAKNYIESENRLFEISNLSVALPLDLFAFLHNPEEGMMRLIYNRLFEMVQRKIPEDDFERMAEGDLNADAAEMFRMGYAAWAALALVLMLEPDEFFGVALDEAHEPLVAGLGEIAFGRQFHHPAKRIPEFLFHSKKLDSYIAFKMPLAREVHSYLVPLEIPTQRLLRNRNGDSSSALDYRVMFLSIVPDLKKAPVYVDFHERTIHGPDLMIEFLMKQDLSDPKIIQQVQNRAEIMKPRFGVTIVLMDSYSKSGSFAIKGNIDAVPIGLERSQLRPILDKLVTANEMESMAIMEGVPPIEKGGK